MRNEFLSTLIVMLAVGAVWAWAVGPLFANPVAQGGDSNVPVYSDDLSFNRNGDDMSESPDANVTPITPLPPSRSIVPPLCLCATPHSSIAEVVLYDTESGLPLPMMMTTPIPNEATPFDVDIAAKKVVMFYFLPDLVTPATPPRVFWIFGTGPITDPSTGTLKYVGTTTRRSTGTAYHIYEEIPNPT